MADEENNEEGQEEEEPKKGKGKLIIIIVVVLVLLGGGGGAALFLMGGDTPEGEEGNAEPEVVLEQVQLAPFVVNLSQNTQFLKVILVLEYDANLIEGNSSSSADEAEGEGAVSDTIPFDLPGVLATREAHVRDAVVTILSSKTAEQVLTVEGKELLKEELLEAVNDATALDEPPVVAVYFLEFIVQ